MDKSLEPAKIVVCEWIELPDDAATQQRIKRAFHSGVYVGVAVVAIAVSVAWAVGTLSR